MFIAIAFAVVLPCAGMGAIFSIYLLLLWCSIRQERGIGYAEKEAKGKGLSESDLEKLPRVQGVLTCTECAVCLEDIEDGQVARLLPTCNHAFHLRCADTWLARKPVCPVCRAEQSAAGSMQLEDC